MVISKSGLGYSKVKTVRVYVWTGLTIILFLSEIDFPKLNKLLCCDCVVNLSLIVFQTDPVNFVLNQKCSGQTEYISRLGIAWSFRSWKQEASPRVI